MSEREFSKSLEKPTTRRTVLRTGAKLAYAAPVVAATFALADDAAAGGKKRRKSFKKQSYPVPKCECPAGTHEVTLRSSSKKGLCAICPTGYRYDRDSNKCKHPTKSWKWSWPTSYDQKVCPEVTPVSLTV